MNSKLMEAMDEQRQIIIQAQQLQAAAEQRCKDLVKLEAPHKGPFARLLERFKKG